MNKPLIWILLAGALLFIPFLGQVHLFDWDEINFAECSREMMLLKDYGRVYIDFKPFWEKPPLFFWLQCCSMFIFGVTEFAARFPNAVCGLATLTIIFLCGQRLYTTRFGVLWAAAFGGSLFPSLYFKSGIIDPWFNLFIFVSVYFAIRYHWAQNKFDLEGKTKSPAWYILISGCSMGLAILTKGQVALIMFGLMALTYWILNRGRIYFTLQHILLFVLATSLVMATWYGYEIAKNGTWFIREFLVYQYRLFSTHDAGQKGFPGYHYVVILIGCFPASVIAIRSFFRMPAEKQYDRDFRKWMLILFWVVTLLFSIVQSRIVHYSSLAWFPVTFLCAYTWYAWEKNRIQPTALMYTGIIIIGGLLALLTFSIPWIGQNIDVIQTYVKDEFARANMEADVKWLPGDSLIGLFLLASVICSIVFLRKQKYQIAFYSLFGGTAIFVFFASAVLVPKIEQYSQAAAIEFFIERKGEDCYVHPMGYKTYGHLFYTQKPIPENPKSYDQNWLLTGQIDKPVYFITKINRAGDISQTAGIVELYRKNGFVFFKREIPTSE